MLELDLAASASSSAELQSEEAGRVQALLDSQTCQASQAQQQHEAAQAQLASQLAQLEDEMAEVRQQLEDQKEGVEQQRMAAQADLIHFKAKLATQDSEVISLRKELESELQAQAQHKVTNAELTDQLATALGQIQELNNKHFELVSQVSC